MITFEKVTKSFRRVDVLNGIDLTITRGDRVALVGSNGAGKTTLIRCLLGEYLHGGAVRVNGLDPRLHRGEVLKRVGFVPQLPPLLKMRVGQLLHFAAGVCEGDVERMSSVARDLGLDVAEIFRRPFDKLSGGQKQKLLIAIALGRDCDLLVMDEPAANLDPDARHTFFTQLARRQAAAMIISSHRLDEVAALVNRVVEMDRGRIVLDDHVADQVDLACLMACRVALTRADPAFAESIREWKFESSDGGVIWQGRVAGPDRLRFLGVISRYAAILKGLQIEDETEKRERKMP